MELIDRLLAGCLPGLPKPLVGFFASPYVAGETQEEGLRAARHLNGRDMAATLDVLGEHVQQRDQTEKATDAYLRLLDGIHEARLDANVSLKLTQLGLKLDRKLCEDNLVRVLERARERDNFVRIDMEDSSCTDATLEIHHRLREAFPRIGVVLQAVLKRTVADARALAATRANVRICKGIYVEPPEIAYRDREPIRESFLATLEVLLKGGSYVGVATHDERLVEASRAMVEDLGLARTGRHEFQMLLGVREPLRDTIVRLGYRLRVYIPFGPDWYAYSMRRLRENPTIARYVAGALLHPSTWRRRRY